jgi:hypothetical protein
MNIIHISKFTGQITIGSHSLGTRLRFVPLKVKECKTISKALMVLCFEAVTSQYFIFIIPDSNDGRETCTNQIANFLFHLVTIAIKEREDDSLVLAFRAAHEIPKYYAIPRQENGMVIIDGEINYNFINFEPTIVES